SFGSEKSDRGCPGAFTSLRGGCGASPSLPAGEGRRAGSGPADLRAAGADSAACSGRLAGRILKFRRGDGTPHSTDPRAILPRAATLLADLQSVERGTRDPGPGIRRRSRAKAFRCTGRGSALLRSPP